MQLIQGKNHIELKLKTGIPTQDYLFGYATTNNVWAVSFSNSPVFQDVPNGHYFAFARCKNNDAIYSSVPFTVNCGGTLPPAPVSCTTNFISLTRHAIVVPPIPITCILNFISLSRLGLSLGTITD